MEKINKGEIARQLVHIAIGLTIVLLLYFDFIKLYSLIIITIIAFIFFYFIKKYKPKSTLICKVLKILKKLERKNEIEEFRGRGALFYLIGILIVIALFEKDIAMASIMILALGDSFSRLIGPFGKIKHPFNNLKCLEGIIAGWIAASLGAMLIIKPFEAITASAVAMLIEGLDIKLFKFQIDDNLTIPVIAGFVIWLIRII